MGWRHQFPVHGQSDAGSEASAPVQSDSPTRPSLSPPLPPSRVWVMPWQEGAEEASRSPASRGPEVPSREYPGKRALARSVMSYLRFATKYVPRKSRLDLPNDVRSSTFRSAPLPGSALCGPATPDGRSATPCAGCASSSVRNDKVERAGPFPRYAIFSPA